MPLQQWTIILLSYFILMAGIAELIVSGIAISSSSAFGAAWYTGLACIFSGVQGIRLGPKNEISRRFVKWIFAASLFSAVFSIFGSALDGNNYFIFKNLKTCATESSIRIPSCYNGTLAPFYECYGDPSYNDAAVKCQQESNSGTCSCVSSSSSSDCDKSLDGFPTCLFIITDYVKLLHGSFILCLLCLLSSGILLLFCSYLWCCVPDLREESMQLNDSLVLSECPAVIPAEAHVYNNGYEGPLRPSQIPVNVSFVDIRPAGDSTIERYAAGDTSRVTTTSAPVARPSAVQEVVALTPNPDDAIVTPVQVAYPLQPLR